MFLLFFVRISFRQIVSLANCWLSVLDLTVNKMNYPNKWNHEMRTALSDSNSNGYTWIELIFEEKKYEFCRTKIGIVGTIQNFFQAPCW